MGASRDGHCKEAAKFSICRADAGGAVALLEVVSDLLDSHKVSDGCLD